VKLTSAGATDYDLYLFGPTATNVLSDTPLASSTGASYPEEIAFRAAEAGTYYVAATRVSGSGSYGLVWGVTTDPDGEIPGAALPASPVAGNLAPVVDDDDVYQMVLGVGDRLSVEMTGAPVTDFDLYLYGPTATDRASTPLAVGVRATYPETLTWTVTQAGRYCIDVRRFSGTGAYILRWTVVSPIPTGVSVPGVSPSRPRRGKLVTFYSGVSPGAATVSAGSTIYLYRYETATVRKKVRGRWRRVSVKLWRLRAAVAMAPGASGSLVATTKLRYAGKWRAQVVYAGSADYLPSVSGVRSFVVR
jgi:hypothetical protein